MARYGRFKYEEDGSPLATVYGADGVPALSVYPFNASVVDYNRIDVTWVNPSGEDILRFRLLRNQEGIPDNAEDGIQLIDAVWGPAVPSSFQDTGITADGSIVPLIRGRHVYYSIWLWTLEVTSGKYRWYLVDTVQTTVPSEHAVAQGNAVDTDGTPIKLTGVVADTHTQMMNNLPRIMTSDNLNAFGAIDYNSDLSKFLRGFSFTADQLMTLADLLIPAPGLVNFTPDLLNTYSLNFGIEPDNRTDRKPTKFQRKLVSNAIPMYINKGKIESLSALIESLTGYAPSITASPNLILSAQDATFYQGVGNWVIGSGVSSITPTNVGNPPLGGEATATELSYRVDSSYYATVVVNNATNSITNGRQNPVLTGIPVIPGFTYAFSIYQKKTSVTAEEITLGIKWHDFTGKAIGSEVTLASDVTTAWSKVTTDALTAPSGAAFATLSISFSATGTYFLDMAQFSDYSQTDFREPRGVGVYLSPSKTNLITNPSFEVDTDGWTAVNATLAAVSSSSNPIPGQINGSKYLQVSSSAPDEVVVTTDAVGAVSGSGDVTFSAFTFSEGFPADGVAVKLEAFAKDPYTNYVFTPTPTAAPTTGWSYSGGTFTTTFPTSGGPEADAHVLLTYGSVQTSGEVTIDLANAAVDVDGTTLLDDAEYTFAMWLKPSAEVTAFPTVVWTVLADPDIVGSVDEDVTTSGDEVILPAGVWTRVEFTSQAPFGAGAVSLEMAVDKTGLGTLGIYDAQFFPVTYSVEGVFENTDNKWARGSLTLPIPDTILIPAGVDGFTVRATLSYTSDSDEVLIDLVQLEDGYRASDYFDGSFVFANWKGTANESVSDMYYNKDVKLTRIQQKIRNFLPMGTPFYIETSDGVEFGGGFKGYA